MALQIYVALSLVGGPDRSGQSATAIPSLDPSLHWCLGCWWCYRTEFSPSREKERVVAVVELPAILGASGSKSQGGLQQDSSFLLAILIALQDLRM